MHSGVRESGEADQSHEWHAHASGSLVGHRRDWPPVACARLVSRFGCEEEALEIVLIHPVDVSALHGDPPLLDQLALGVVDAEQALGSRVHERGSVHQVLAVLRVRFHVTPC